MLCTAINVTVIPTLLTPTEGELAVFTCSLHPNTSLSQAPTTQFKWIRADGTEVEAAGNSSVLVFESLQRTDTGVYHCRARVADVWYQSEEVFILVMCK